MRTVLLLCVSASMFELKRLFVQSEDSPQQSRAITRIWQRFKTAQ